MASRREPAGRDLGLTVRMAAAPTFVAEIYLVAAALSLARSLSKVAA